MGRAERGTLGIGDQHGIARLRFAAIQKSLEKIQGWPEAMRSAPLRLIRTVCKIPV